MLGCAILELVEISVVEWLSRMAISTGNHAWIIRSCTLASATADNRGAFIPRYCPKMALGRPYAGSSGARPCRSSCTSRPTPGYPPPVNVVVCIVSDALTIRPKYTRTSPKKGWTKGNLKIQRYDSYKTQAIRT